MYKLIAIDIDGTLVDSYGHISERNKLAIQKAKEKGIEVVITSGRNPMSIKNLALEVKADNYIICGNGAMIYDLKKEEIIYKQFIDKKVVLELIKICEENSVYYSINTLDAIITKTLNFNVLFYYQENNGKPDNKKTNIYLEQDIYNYVQNTEQNDYLKISICDNDNIIFNSILKRIRRINNIDVLDVAHMSRKIIKTGTEETEIGYYYTEITNKNVDKWTAIKYLINKLNIYKEEVITIGDNVNDQTMLKNAGMGVAMGNSAPYVKEIAKKVTDNNDQDGVAKAIEELINC